MTPSRTRWGGIAAVVLAAVLGAAAALPTDARAEGIAYLLRIGGIKDDALRKMLQGVSRLKRLEGSPVASMGALRRRTQRDLEQFSRVLHAEGYYDHAIEYRIDTSREPLRVRVRIDTGPAYELSSFDVILKSAELGPAMEAVGRARAGLKLGGPARAKDVMGAEGRVLAELSRSAFPFPELVDRQVVVDHATRVMIVHSTIATGARAVFDGVVVEGVDPKLADYARARAPWKEGDPYNPDKVEDLRNKLAGAGVFASVRVRPADALDAQGSLPILVDVEPGKSRSIGLGAGYSSSEGGQGSAYWEHRNLFGRAERLRIGGEVAQIGYTARLTFAKPDFLAIDQKLLYEAAYEIDDTEAFESREFKTSLGLERPLWEPWTGIAGVSYEVGEVTDADDVETNVQFVGFPVVLRRDTSDDPLNPTKGMKLEIGATPYVEEIGSDASILISRVGNALYWPLDLDRNVVVAGRAALGAITGAGRFIIPADKRFYAGGGGSVRGFAFQVAGPLNDDDDPLGGRSLAEVSAELRWRVWRNFGVVPFIDGGNVYAEEFPVFDHGLFWGAGLGLRYYTRVGPIRLDVATPLNPRSGVDDPVQFYISLGQSY